MISVERLMIKKRFLILFPVLCAVFCSCGLEAYYYIAPVPKDSITMELSNTATIKLPSSSYEGYSSYFTNFIIFYRVYISDTNQDTKIDTETLMETINRSLRDDWRAIYPSTDITSTTVNTSIGTLFSNRKYYTLELEGQDINSRLSNASLGATLAINFPTLNGVRPTMAINGTPYTLYRTNNGGVLKPEPDRYFLNSPDLYSSANTQDANKNADVADKSGISPSPRYTYVSMYIAAQGQDYLTYFYSMPTWIGVFKLPQSN